MNTTTRALIACMVAIGAWVVFQQVRPADVAKPAAKDSSCTAPGGG